jgi:ornithine cyclodeaminase
VIGAKPGRISDDQITICDLTGTGAQDTAIATLAHAAARAAGAGAVMRA